MFHFIKVLELVADSPVEQGALSKRLGIGEGATRTLIERLKKELILSISKPGCTLTEKGEQLWKRIEQVIPSKIELEKSKLTLPARNVAILAKGKASKVKLGWSNVTLHFWLGPKEPPRL
jgi:Mn-dependent DtxR family transcriptional regulator